MPLNLCRRVARSKASKFRKSVCYAAVCVCLYQVWSSRNESYWNQKVPTVENAMRQTKYNVQNRIKARFPKKISCNDLVWFEAL